MANHKRKVSSDDFLACHAYFQRAIQTNRFMSYEAESIRNLAILSFESIVVDSIDSDSLNAFQAWIDEYVDTLTWRRCYKALNQKSYLNKNRQHAITITHEAYEGLKNRAAQYNMSLSTVIVQLLNNDKGFLRPLEEFNDAGSSKKKSAGKVLYLVTKSKKEDEDIDALDSSLIDEESYFNDEDAGIDSCFDFFNQALEQPRKPEGYDFRNNESYKNYRRRINRLTVKKQDEALIDYFNKHLYLYLTEDNCKMVGEKLLAIRKNLLDDNRFSNQFKPEYFALSKGITLSSRYEEAYSDELTLFLCDFFGCDTRTISSGNRTPVVFAGNKNHVQIAFKAFHYLNAFLSDEMEQYSSKCHKNTKPKNRRRKAGWHANSLLYKMFAPEFLDDECFKLYSEEQGRQLSEYGFKHIGLYFDENEPLGGWYQPPKNKKRKEDIFLW